MVVRPKRKRKLGPKQIETMKLSLGPLLCVLWPVGGFHSSKTLHHRDDEVVVVVEEGREEGGGVVDGGNCDRFGVTKNFTRRHPTGVYRQKNFSGNYVLSKLADPVNSIQSCHSQLVP
jgi:hypothetical protein